MEDQHGCLACDLTNGRRPLPGGQIWSTDHWVVEHCTGPLGVGTLIVKPRRHVVHVAELDDAEAREMGPLLQRTTAVVTQLAKPDQVYVCLWSHGPVHIHFVVQPTNAALEAEWGAHGPGLQVAMFRAGDTPDEHDVGAFADAARRAFTAS